LLLPKLEQRRQQRNILRLLALMRFRFEWNRFSTCKMSVKQQWQQKNNNKKAKQDVPRSHPPVILKPGTRHHNTHPLRHHDACAAHSHNANNTNQAKRLLRAHEGGLPFPEISKISRRECGIDCAVMRSSKIAQAAAEHEEEGWPRITSRAANRFRAGRHSTARAR